MKLCQKCKETKPLSEFYNDASRPDGLTYRCKTCVTAANKIYTQSEKGRATARKKYGKWRAANLEVARGSSRESNKRARAKDRRRFKSYELKAHYGITVDQYDALLARQSGGCAICCASEPGGMGVFHVDHCHNSSQIRGLLCTNCNAGLGQFKDDPSRLARAINYLAEAGAKS